MEKSKKQFWDVTLLRPSPPTQFYHHINEKNMCIAKICKYIIIMSYLIIIK